MAATRLQLAARIHFAVRRHLGTSVDISSMLKDAAYADEILMVCRSLGDDELQRLADQFEDQATQSGPYRVPGDRGADLARFESRIRKPISAGRSVDRSHLRDTSGFGVTQFAMETRERLKREVGARKPWWQPLVRLAGL
jgi:hypothetical protein